MLNSVTHGLALTPLRIFKIELIKNVSLIYPEMAVKLRREPK